MAKAEPHSYVYRLLFQAQICGASNPVILSLERQTTRFSVSGQSMPALCGVALIVCTGKKVLVIFYLLICEIGFAVIGFPSVICKKIGS